MWLDPGSNRGHADFQSAALPAELSSHFTDPQQLTTRLLFEKRDSDTAI
jgi:hypothetical protein